MEQQLESFIKNLKSPRDEIFPIDMRSVVIVDATPEEKRKIKKIIQKEEERHNYELFRNLDIYIYNNLPFDLLGGDFDEALTKVYDNTYHVINSDLIIDFLEKPINLHFYDTDIDFSKYIIPDFFKDFFERYEDLFLNNELPKTMAFSTGAQTKIPVYYEFMNYMPFWRVKNHLNREIFVMFAININTSSDDYGEIIYYEQDDSETGFYNHILFEKPFYYYLYKLYDYTKFIDIFEKNNINELYHKSKSPDFIVVDEKVLNYHDIFVKPLYEEDEPLIKFAGKTA